MIPGAFLITFIHEFMHALAVWAQGGKVLDFVWTGESENWGHVDYSFPATMDYNSTIISLAPYLFAMLILLIGLLISFVPFRKSYFLSSLIFVWLVLIPLGEIAYVLYPYSFYNSQNDLYHVAGNRSWWFILISLILSMAGVWLAYISHVRLFKSEAVTARAFVLLSLIPLAILAGGVI